MPIVRIKPRTSTSDSAYRVGMSRIALIAAASLAVATLAPVAVLGTAEAAKPKPKPKLTAAAPKVFESLGQATVTLKLPAKAKKPVKVAWRTVDGTAKAGTDYQARKGTATIKKGKRSAAITIRLVSDAVHEQTERFAVRLTSSQAKVPAKPVTITVTDDDKARPAPTAPSALTGTITVSSMSIVPSGTTTLTMNVHLVPTATAGQWRDDGTGSWTISGSLMNFAGVCILMPTTTTVSGTGTFLTGAGEAATAQSTLLLDGFDASGATGTPTLSWAGKATSTTPTYNFDPMNPLMCTPAGTATADYPFTIDPPATGTYTGTTGPGRGVDFAYDVPASVNVTGSLTPVS